jgi:hypothetical protein
MEPFWFLTAIVIMIPRIDPLLHSDSSSSIQALKQPI